MLHLTRHNRSSIANRTPMSCQESSCRRLWQPQHVLQHVSTTPTTWNESWPMTSQVRLYAPFESMLVCWLFHSLLNIPINYQASIHPMALLPAFAPTSDINIADHLSKPLSRHRFDILIGDLHSPTIPTSVDTATVDPSATVAPAPASTVVPFVSDSVPSLHPNPAPTLPIVLDTGASYSRAPSAADFLPVGHASYGLIRSPILVVSKALASTPVDPYTLITGEDGIDLSSLDLSALNSNSVGTSFTKATFDIREFGTATLTFIYSKSTSELLRVFVEPTQIDWIHWVPLPRLTPTESYFHIFGRDYLQAFALFHLIPIWIALVSALLRSD